MDNPVQGTAETLKSAFSTAIEAGSAMHPGGSANSLFSGGGEMGQLMRALDWSQTPVGPVSQWPHSLRTAVRIILNSRYAMFVWWGRELVNLYNDPYRAFLGTKHPHALGKSASEVWNEIWDQIGPRTEAVLLRGESTYDEALLLLMERHGYLEETYFTFSYSPLPDDEGTIGGLFCAVTEETQKVIGERRLAVLREIAAAMAESRTTVQVCQSAARSLVQAQRDLPFSAIYILGHDGKALSRMGEAGVCESHPAAPDLVRLDDGAECVWPFRKVMESGEPVFVDSIPANVAELPKGEWEHPPRSVILLPLAQQGQSRPAGVFLAGLNPYRKFDDDFRGFLSLLSNQIASGIANAIAYETERRRAESLAELDRAKTTFFSNVSHEFRTPLTLLLGPVEEALADTNRSSIDMKRLQVVHRNGLRLLKLVNSLLDFSRIEAGRVKASFEPVDISTLTSDLASGFRSLIERAGLTLNVDCPPLSRRVFVDREMWEKIVLNLLSNAFKFTFHGTVAISQRLVDEHVVLTVKDTGTGIPKRELANVFERFHRIEGAKGRSFEGTGIGLALVQELVKLHNGSINVESEEGVGTTFTVTVPAGSAQGSLDSAARSTVRYSASTRLDLYVEEASRWTSSTVPPVDEQRKTNDRDSGPKAGSDTPTVLVVDDNADMREYIGRLLKDEYRLRFACNGQEAVAIATEAPPDLVLTDVMMPGLDGVGLVQELRGNPLTRTVPIVMLSARAGDANRVEGLHAGADDYLTKPFTAAELLARVETHIKMARVREQAETKERRLRTEAEAAQRTVSRVLDSITDAFITLDRDWRITYINPEAARINGKPAEAFLGRSHWEEWPASVGTRVEAQYHRAMLERVPVHFEHRYVDAEHDVFLDIHAYPTDDGLAVYYRDVTEKKKADEVVKAAHERLTLAQQTASLATWDWNLADGTVVWANGSAAVYGSPPHELGTIEKCAARVVEEDRAATMNALEAAIEHGSEYNHEFRVQWPDGSIHWLVGRGRAICDGSGRAVRVLGINWDITGKKQIEAELRNERTRLAELFQQAPAFIAVLRGPEFVFELTNGPYQQLIGNRNVIGRRLTEALPEVESQGIPQLVQSVYESGEPYVAQGFRLEIARKPGQQLEARFLDFVYQPVRDGGGQVSRIIALGVDTTEQRRTQEALVRSEKLAAVGRLAASIAHEINNPLEAVTNLIYLIETSAVADDVKAYAAIASQELRRVSEITTQTLRFHRQASGPLNVRIGSLIDSLFTVYQGRFTNNSIRVERSLRDQQPVCCLEGEVRQVLSNMVGNAIDALPSGGRLIVRSRDGRRHSDGREGIYITVADAGVGMTASVKERLFDAFFTTKQGTGTGLGLWISRNIIEKHDGTIRFRSSQGPRRHGTVFRVFLPYDAMREESSAANNVAVGSV